MSPSPFSETRIGLFAGCCGAVRLRGVVRKTVVESRITPWEYGGGDALAHERLAASLGGFDVAGKDVTLVLGGRHSRYFALAPASALKHDAEWLTFARARAAQAFGGAPENWRITLSETTGGVRVAAAIEAARFKAVISTIESAGAKPKRVVPYLSFAFERVRRGISAEGRLWLALAEPEAVTLIGVDRKRIVRIAQHRIGTDATASVAQALVREEIQLSWAPETVPILWQAGAQTIATEGRRNAFELPAAVSAILSPSPAERDALVTAMLH